MKKILLFILITLILVALIALVPWHMPKGFQSIQPNSTNTQTVHNTITPTAPANDLPRAAIIASDLEVAWSIAFLPDTSMLVTERPGRIRLIDASGKLDQTPIATFSDVYSQTAATGEDGLLGVAVDPQYSTNHFVFFYYTYQDIQGNTLNRVVRYQFQNKQLSDRHVLVDKIPGNYHHDGGRLEFGPDGYLYITTGDSLRPSYAQDKNQLAGKILRITRDGAPAPNNPFLTEQNQSARLVYSYGHRNPQGLAWDRTGQLYEVEHGDTAHDEINIIHPGNNYGWPIIQGDQTQTGMITPLKNSESVTWAPSGMAYLNGAFYFAALKGEALYKAIINGNNVTLTAYLQGTYGRIRAVTLGPDGMLYISTSNRDGRATPRAGDDHIVRINPNKL